jgi:U3 small nucleolar RNA-associated protein 21
MEPIIDFTTETTRDRDWDNVACVHRDTTTVTTWSFGDQKMGDLKLRHERFKTDQTLRAAKSTCLCLTFCGNFVLVGYDSGHVDKYNIQSGIHRGFYEVKKGMGAAHPKREIRGICTDGLNQIVLTADNQGLLQFWNFNSNQFLSRLKLSSAVVQMEMHRDSSLVAVSLADFSLEVVDAVARKLVRTFSGHAHQITDLCFSADSRWIMSASLDSTVKVWDVPAGKTNYYIGQPNVSLHVCTFSI